MGLSIIHICIKLIMGYSHTHRFNVIQWKKIKITLMFFVAWGIISQFLTIIMHHSITTYNEHQILTQRKVFSTQDVIEYKNQRWKALVNLDGRIFKKTESMECESIWSKEFLRNFNQQTPIKAFSGSQLYSYPKHVDVPKMLCLFRQGKSIYNESIIDRQFKPIITQPLLCGKSKENTVDLLILIKSALFNMQRRVAIRSHWGDTRCWAGRTVRTVFILGMSTKRYSSWIPHVNRENATYGDIIQQDFEDYYYNNTYKFLFGLQWSIAYCPEAKWLAFVDDDFFVNPRQVLSFLESVDPRLQKHLVVGDMVVQGTVLRGKSKWNVNASMFPYRNYPNFVQGGALFMSASMALDIYVGSRFTKFFPFDDVFVGIVMSKLLISPAHVQGLFIQSRKFTKHSLINDSIAVHKVGSLQRHQWLWKYAHLNTLCNLTV